MVPRAPKETTTFLQSIRLELIRVAAKFAKENHTEVAHCSLQTLHMGIDAVFCNPVVGDGEKEKISREFGKFGLIWQGPGPGPGTHLHCVPCNHRITILVRQNLIDHVISDHHDKSLVEGVYATSYHTASGYPARQEQRIAAVSRRENNKTGGIKRAHAELQGKAVEQRLLRRKAFHSEELPPVQPKKAESACVQEANK